MKDIEIILENKPGMLALVGETLGKHGVSLEGGGVFQTQNASIAHFLVKDANKAVKVLADVQINVVQVNEVIIQRLRQDIPGQLGHFCRKMSAAGVNILVQYSDHYNQLIVVVDDIDAGMKVSKEWEKQNYINN